MAQLDAFFMVVAEWVRYHFRTDMEPSTHPYRDVPVPTGTASKPLLEELVLYALFVAIGAIPVVLALVHGGTFGVDATLGLLMISAGALGALAHAWRIRRHRQD